MQVRGVPPPVTNPLTPDSERSFLCFFFFCTIFLSSSLELLPGDLSRCVGGLGTNTSTHDDPQYLSTWCLTVLTHSLSAFCLTSTVFTSHFSTCHWPRTTEVHTPVDSAVWQGRWDLQLKLFADIVRCRLQYSPKLAQFTCHNQLLLAQCLRQTITMVTTSMKKHTCYVPLGRGPTCVDTHPCSSPPVSPWHKTHGHM